MEVNKGTIISIFKGKYTGLTHRESETSYDSVGVATNTINIVNNVVTPDVEAIVECLVDAIKAELDIKLQLIAATYNSHTHTATGPTAPTTPPASPMS